MKKGIGPQGLGASKSPAMMKSVKSPTKQTKKANTDEMGREGHFNPYTKKTKGSGRAHAPIDSNYTEKYQNATVKPTSIESGYSKKVGYQEERMRSNSKRDNVMGLRAEAYKNNENKFGVKKPKANIK